MAKLPVLPLIMQLANPWFILRFGSVPQDLGQHLRRFEASSLGVMEYRKGHIVFLLAARSNANFEFLVKIHISISLPTFNPITQHIPLHQDPLSHDNGLEFNGFQSIT